MLSLDDELWKYLKGGYGSEFDASVPLAELFTGKNIEDIWYLLWDELHHQGDVGDASYASVPHLLRWIEQNDQLDYNPIAIIALIENCRWGNNPQPRTEIAEAYFQAISDAPNILIQHRSNAWNDEVCQASLWLIAAAKGNQNFTYFLNYFDVTSAKETLNEDFGYKWIEQSND